MSTGAIKVGIDRMRCEEILWDASDVLDLAGGWNTQLQALKSSNNTLRICTFYCV